MLRALNIRLDEVDRAPVRLLTPRVESRCVSRGDTHWRDDSQLWHVLERNRIGGKERGTRGLGGQMDRPGTGLRRKRNIDYVNLRPACVALTESDTLLHVRIEADDPC